MMPTPRDPVSGMELQQEVAAYLARTESIMREFEGRALLYGEEAAREWLHRVITEDAAE